MGNMKRTLSDNLLCAARSLLVLVFVVHLTIVVVGYYVLPGQVVAWADPESGHGRVIFHDQEGNEYVIKNPLSQSKEYFLGVWTIFATVLLLVGFVGPYIAIKAQQPDQQMDYWNREENLVLRGNITGIWQAFYCGMGILYFSLTLFLHFPVPVPIPASKDMILVFGLLAILGIILFVVPYVLLPLTLTLVKHYRERRQRLSDAPPSEPQV